MSKAMRQMLDKSGRVSVAHGEAVRDLISDEACGPLLEHPDTGSAKPRVGTGGLLEAALTRQNLQEAFKRVKANKGAAGVDGQGIGQTAELLRTNWPDIRQELLAGRYRPQPVRKVMIPKPDGSQRELGIPTVLDRRDRCHVVMRMCCAPPSGLGQGNAQRDPQPVVLRCRSMRLSTPHGGPRLCCATTPAGGLAPVARQ